ncbi:MULTISPECIES: helix-turn-helix domain-containing protein [unclassified Streptomyces]|uniref:helix-turn-helix domain-containing protein n=1 Tax=unclassified Streptomyces TaxID=2593676 RepID=UPI00315DAA61
MELRKMREAAGRTARDAAALLSVVQPKMSQIESGRAGVSEERVRTLASFYECADGALVDALSAMTHEFRGQFWFDEYRGILTPGFLDVAELEWHACALKVVQTVTLPGILQTADYSRALFSSVWPRLPEEQIDARVEHRLRRSAVLDRDHAPGYEALIHEAALRMRYGGRRVVREQLEAILTAAERPGVTVRVIPFTTEEFVEVTQPVLYATGVVPQLDTVHIDSAAGGWFVDAAAQLNWHSTVLDMAAKVSLEPDESKQLIHHIAREL